MEALALGVALMFSFALALSLQWGLLAVIVRHMTRGAVATVVLATSSPRAGASSGATGAASPHSSSAWK